MADCFSKFNSRKLPADCNGEECLDCTGDVGALFRAALYDCELVGITRAELAAMMDITTAKLFSWMVGTREPFALRARVLLPMLWCEIKARLADPGEQQIFSMKKIEQRRAVRRGRTR